jgi:hypothetical protein
LRVVERKQVNGADFSRASVWKSDLWRHADREASRQGAVRKLVKMLKELIAEAEAEGLRIAPFAGVACPGLIDADRTIKKGAQNLPGNWKAAVSTFPRRSRNPFRRSAAMIPPSFFITTPSYRGFLRCLL